VAVACKRAVRGSRAAAGVGMHVLQRRQIFSTASHSEADVAAMRAAHHVQPGVELAKEAERLAVHNQARAAMADVEDRLEAAARMVEAAETQARFFLTVISILYYRILYI